jgi:hypothetical protein
MDDPTSKFASVPFSSDEGQPGFRTAPICGFYKHFDSRDDLVAEAVSSAFGGWKRRVDAAASGGPTMSYAKLIDEYLNEAHCDNPGTFRFESCHSVVLCRCCVD